MSISKFGGIFTLIHTAGRVGEEDGIEKNKK